ncbi:hypothetical protein PQC18_gp67 [Streptomyces phage Pablito]|uniref:DUF7417 domain-containing protein n=1 Tax=Streptomyces phage Pablito TaxID=2894593 RepID=A0AAE9C7E8_9CAUD|nr:hypothetical protein PQC18_gp67 [Streptomyces phage Pablito]UFD98005.1 hypothetical protein [Streptomyces phage Pablito]
MSRMKDLAIDLMSYEAGELNDDEKLELFGTLIKSGMCWTLGEHYWDEGSRLIDARLITEEGDVTPEVIPA